MDPISLGVAAAALFAAKLIARLGERAGDKVADSVIPVREHIEGLLEAANQDTSILQQVEQAPDSKIAVDRLAAVIAEAARHNPGYAQNLAQFVTLHQPIARKQQAGTFQINMADESKVDNIYQANRDITIKSDRGT